MPPFGKCSSTPALFAMAVALAANPVAAQSAASYDIDIPATDVAAAVARLRAETGVNVVVAVGATGTTRAVKGRMSARQAVDLMLGGSGLRAAWAGGDVTIVSSAASQGGGETQLGTVRVSAAGSGGGDGSSRQVAQGANGSTDATATEGTRSYTATETNIGGKVPTAIKDVPQSVTVVTRQRIEDQQLNTLADVLEQTPGVTVLQNNNTSQLQPSFYSRGFAIQNFQIDGGAPINYGGGSGGDTGNYTSTLTPVFDMSLYDHVEVLRGADGTFAGVGDPGGVLSLERKRPLDHRQFVVEATGGSWSAARFSADASTPLTADGTLKVRLVGTHDQRDYFYHPASKQLDLVYANLEYDPTTRTRLNVGASYTIQSGVPWSSGLPRYQDGGDLNLPRGTCLCLSFGNYNTKQLEIFAQAEQHFGDKWSLNANLSTLRQNSRILEGDLVTYGGIDRATSQIRYGGGPVQASRTSTRSEQYSADLYLTGSFRLFGQEQHLVIGGNYQKQNDGANPKPGDGTAFLDNILYLSSFSPDGYTVPSDASFSPVPVTVPVYERTQYAAYATLRLTPLPRVHVNVGLRYNQYETRQSTVYTYPNFSFSQNKVFSESRFVPPLASLSYDLTSKTTVYGSYSGIYISQADRRTSDGSVLHAATGRNIEFGVKRSDFGGKLNSSLAVYDIVQNNLAVQLLTGPNSFDPATGINCCYSPIGSRNKSRGLDFEVSGAITPRWQISTGYTHNTNQFDPSALAVSNGSSVSPIIAQAPRDLLKLFSSYRLGTSGWLGRTTLGGGGRYQSPTRTFYSIYTCGATSCTSTLASIVQPTYALADLFGRLAVTPAISVQVNVNNVFDKRYYATVGSVQGGNFYGEPRNFSVALRGKF